VKHIALLVEGNLDETTARCIVEKAGGTVSTVYGKRGAGYVKQNIEGFNNLAKGTPVLAIADLMDTDFDCPARAVEAWLPHRNEMMLFRLVVREIESWLLADRSNVAQFLGVPKKKIPRRPERLDDPKRNVVNLARQSRYRRIRELLVPEEGVSASEGPGYTSEMQTFVREAWHPGKAREKSESLARCVVAVAAFLEKQNS
jgi:hypothetical protein